jgi:hypothetical protein
MLRSGVFSTVQWTKGIDGTVTFAVRAGLEKHTDVRKLAARAAVDAPAPAFVGNR